jgi:hypothetical protein
MRIVGRSVLNVLNLRLRDAARRPVRFMSALTVAVLGLTFLFIPLAKPGFSGVPTKRLRRVLRHALGPLQCESTEPMAL